MEELDKAHKALLKMKNIESKTKMYSKRINNSTVVYSNKQENIELYEEACR